MKRIIKTMSIITFAILLILPSIITEASSSIKISYNGTTYTYKDKQIKVTVNGKKVSSDTTPGIITEGIAIVPTDIFSKSSIGATCKYNSSTKVITIIKDSTTIKMTLNSKIAYVNGSKYTMSTTPKQVKYKSVGTTKILVPARFVADRLGYNYIWDSNKSTSSILTNGLNIHYDNKWNWYTSTKGKVTLDGKKVNVTSLPSIIINSTALVQAKKVFKNSIGADYNYNTKTKVLILSKENTTIKLTMGSKTAFVNGVKKTMSTAPRLVTLKSTGDSYVMVPGEFVATNLGYLYLWNSASGTSVITSKIQDSSQEDTEDVDKVTDVPTETDNKILMGEFFNWQLLDDYINDYTKVVNLSDSTRIVATSPDYGVAGELSQSDIIPLEVKSTMISIDKAISDYGIDVGTDAEVFAIKFDLPMSVITASNETDNSLVINIDNAYSNGVSYSYDVGIVNSIISVNEENNLRLDFGLNSGKVKYQAFLMDDNCTLVLVLYNNYISNISAGNEEMGDYVTISGIFTPNYTVSEDAGNLYIDIPYTINGIGEQTATLTNASYITSVISTSLSPDCTRIIISKAEDAEYSITEDSTGIKIIFNNDSNNSNDSNDEIDIISDEHNIVIMKPQGVSFDSLTENDLYLEKKYKIVIPGDHTVFYQNNPIKYDEYDILGVDVLLNNGNTEIIFKTYEVKGFKLEDTNNYFGIKMGTPKEIYKNIVVLDPGHGGSDPGAMYSGVNEKDLNFKILYTYLSSYFDSNSDIKVYYTRTNDTFITLSNRASFASTVEADLFISLHHNAASASAKGTEVYYSTNNNLTQSNGLSSKVLATIFANELPKALGTTNRGVKSAGFVVTKNNTVPAVLIELAFMTNSSDMAKLKSDAFLRKSASTMYDIICKVFNEYPTGR